MLVVSNTQMKGLSRLVNPARKNKSPSMLGSRNRVSAPQATGLSGLPSTYFHSDKAADGSLRIRGCENLGRLSTSANLVLKESFSVNPLNERLFPRTSVLALPFESYELHALKFSYLPACQASLQGNVLMYYDYDPADAPKADDISILAQTTKTASSMWAPCELKADTTRIKKNRERFYVQSDNSLQSGAVLDPAQIRQDYAGTVNLYCSDGPSAVAFGGYLFVEYDISLHTMIPARPVSATWSASKSYSLVESGSQTIPLPYRESGVGLIGGDTSVAAPPWYSAGGIAGYLDGARQIYEAGEWLLNLRSEVTAATYRDQQVKRVAGKTATPLPGAPTWLSIRDDPEETAVVTIEKNLPLNAEGTQTIRRRDRENDVSAAGDFTLNLEAWDVTDGIIDPAWPVTSNGMTYSGQSQTVSYVTAAAFNASNCWNLSVPAGKRYIIKPWVGCGATAGSDRTFGDISFTANVVSQSE